ncbi:serine/threonine-protein kinase [Sphaerisporangium dianthi]|uniref:Serine/threonine-protein kinase n=1 Tax=Sphaerisporangium dianthi TaxID=1436120 RepID=A0ABV9CSH6_9ACTN
MSTPAPLRSGDPERLGGYRLTGRLGEGGQGVVYLAEAPGGGRVALKLMRSRLDEQRARRRFADEVKAIQRVAPFCTAQVLDADLDGDHPYIVSEYVRGVSLQQHVAAEGPLTGGSLDRVAVGTATALAAIHGAGVVHRDFKPGNVLLGVEGPRVIDFGISRLVGATTTAGRALAGTPAYISPEQLRGERAGPAADMFGWALTVAFTASGRHAYAAGSLEATLGRVLFGEADLGPLTGPLRELVVACLAADPANRPGAEEALRHLIGARPVTAPAPPRGGVLETGAMMAAEPPTRENGPDAPASHGPAPKRRRRWPVLAGLVAVAAVAAFGAVWWATGGLGAGGVSYAGTWTGSAEHPAAGRVFPVEIRLPAGDGDGIMRWGADLHCTGRLTRTGGEAATGIFRLDQVRGDQCHTGILRLAPRGAGQVSFQVTDAGAPSPRYAGTAARVS